MYRRRDNILNGRGGFTPLEIEIPNQVSTVSDRGSYRVIKRFLMGFTLVELLVVIAIIALLMSILMPALGRTRRQAQAVICQSQLHSWGVAFQMFADDHEGYFPESDKSAGDSDYWIISLLPYVGVEKSADSAARDIFFCPSATKSKNTGFSINNYGTTFSAWGPFPMGDTSWYDAGASGSYGFNDWCANPPGELYWTMPGKYSFRSPNVTGHKNVPVLLDALYCDGFPMSANIPPPYPDVYDNWFSNAMQIFCIDRHQGGVNAVFIDWSVRNIGIKELWRLKWHKAFDTEDEAPDWASEAPWMKNYKEY